MDNDIQEDDDIDELEASSPWSEALWGGSLVSLIAIGGVLLFTTMIKIDAFRFSGPLFWTMIVTFVVGFLTRLLYLLEFERLSLKKQLNADKYN